eukprot:9158273-Ditylum_brightwellii.AAC.1
MEDPATGMNLTQYHISKGLKVFGKNEFADVDKELRELVRREVMAPLNPDKMTRTEKMPSLQYLMFYGRNAVEG